MGRIYWNIENAYSASPFRYPVLVNLVRQASEKSAVFMELSDPDEFIEYATYVAILLIPHIGGEIMDIDILIPDDVAAIRQDGIAKYRSAHRQPLPKYAFLKLLGSSNSYLTVSYVEYKDANGIYEFKIIFNRGTRDPYNIIGYRASQSFYRDHI